MSEKLLEVEKRLTTLETELPIIKENINDIYDVVYEIRDKIMKQNGVLPHISEQMKESATEHKKFVDKMNEYVLRDSIRTEKIDSKTKIMWAVGGLIFGSLLFFVMKYIGL